MAKRVSAFITVLIILFSCAKEGALTPPDAEKRTTSKQIFGKVLSDDYGYFKNRDSREVLDYIEKENSYTERMMEQTKVLQDSLYAEMIGRMEEDDESVPEKVDSFYYFQRSMKGKDYPVYLRKLRSLDAVEETLLDVNREAEGKLFYDVRIFEMSNDNRYLAYSFDTTGGEKYTLRIYDTKSKTMMKDEIRNITSMAWINDGSGFYYTVENEITRSYALFFHSLNGSAEKKIYEESDEKYSVYLSRTRSREFILASVSSNITSEVMYAQADRPSSAFSLISERKEGVEYYVDHADGYFYVMTNENAKNFKVVRVKPGRDITTAETVEPASDSATIEGVDCFKDYLCVYERINGKKEIKVFDYSLKSKRIFPFEESNYSFYPYSNSVFDKSELRIDYMSLRTPYTTIDINLADFSSEIRKVQRVNGYDRDNYVTEYIFAKAEDGKLVPISLVYRKDLNRKIPAPLLLDGYGAYGSVSDPYFSSARVSLLDRGVIFAIAHIRGGGDMGRGWYEDGKLFNKKNTFLDFISCAEHLINEGYTTKDKIVITGGSAGGLLIGAVLNMRPDLFRGAVAGVPFVDVMNTMLDSTLPLTMGEFDEWGDPNREDYFNYMYEYSPYDNVKKTDYPAMLITAGYNDVRVMYWEPLKWTAKLRDNKTDSNPLLLKMTMNAGHGGESGRYSYYKDIAFEYAFILDILKM
ncbi:MAG: S9 family peptidase [bacterium]|nr:S9 family peptidase [bacterium]